MRRTILFVVIAVLAVMVFPGLGIGVPSGGRSSTPSDVYTTTDPDVCHEVDVKTDPVPLIPTTVSVGGMSDVLVFFSATWNGFHADTELILSVEIAGADLYDRSPDWILPDQQGGQFDANHNGGTIMWTFRDVPPGEYTVQAVAALAAFQGAVHGRGDAVAVQGCSLAAFVMPADGPDGERTATPIGTARVELNREHLTADGYELTAFVPIGSNDDRCLATLAESSFAVSGTTL